MIIIKLIMIQNIISVIVAIMMLAKVLIMIVVTKFLIEVTFYSLKLSKTSFL